MPSYQIVQINTEKSLKTLLPPDFLNKVKLPKGETERIKNKLNHLRKDMKSFETTTTDWDRCISVSFEKNLNLPSNPDVWVPKQLNLIKFDNFFYIGKTNSGLHRFIALFLGKETSYSYISFSKKKLWNLFQNIKSSQPKGIDSIILHRIILKNTYLDSSKINEMNIQAKDVQDVDRIKELVKNCSEIKAITLRFYFLSDPKHITIRIDKNANIVVYGHPPIKKQDIALGAIINIIGRM